MLSRGLVDCGQDARPGSSGTRHLSAELRFFVSEGRTGVRGRSQGTGGSLRLSRQAANVLAGRRYREPSRELSDGSGPFRGGREASPRQLSRPRERQGGRGQARGGSAAADRRALHEVGAAGAGGGVQGEVVSRKLF